ncbi:MAG: ANTAR domain-containing response regulator [Solirubrobacterales bacterium]
MDDSLSVLLADQDKDELQQLAEKVRGCGHEVVDLAVATDEVARAVGDHRPDLAAVLVASDYGHAMDLIEEVRGFAEIPLVVLARDSDPDLLRRAAEHELEVLHLPTDAETVGKLFELAVKRHRSHAAALEQVGQIDSIIERRTVIDTAKGVLMERHGIDSRQAFTMMRDHARAKSIKVATLAEAILASSRLLSEGTADDPEA